MEYHEPFEEVDPPMELYKKRAELIRWSYARREWQEWIQERNEKRNAMRKRERKLLVIRLREERRLRNQLLNELCLSLKDPLDANEYNALAQDHWPSHAEAIELLKNNSKLRRRYPSTAQRGPKYEWHIPGKLANIPVKAHPDTGSAYNILSLSFVVQHGFEPDSLAWTTILLPGNREHYTFGTVRLPFRFEDDQSTHACTFHVLESCPYDVILGREFLVKTKTMTENKHRVRRTKIKDKRAGFYFIGESHAPQNELGNTSDKGLIFGSLNGQTIRALPDSGSDLMFVSSECARRMKLHVDRSRWRREIVQLADGTEIETEGVVDDLNWCFEGDTSSRRRSFYVLSNLHCDVVLSNEFLFDTDAFWIFEQQAHPRHDHIIPDHFITVEAEFQIGACCVMKKLDKIIDHRVAAVKAWETEMQAEGQRRGGEADRIATLPAGKQDAAWQQEFARQAEWKARQPPRPSMPLVHVQVSSPSGGTAPNAGLWSRAVSRAQCLLRRES